MKREACNMKQETTSCQNCKNQFTIEPDDFQFYEKIKFPPQAGWSILWYNFSYGLICCA